MKAFVTCTIAAKTLIPLEEMLNKAKEFPIVKEAYMLYGYADMILKVEYNETVEISALIKYLGKIGVARSETNFVDESLGFSYEKEDNENIEKSAYLFITVNLDSEYAKIPEKIKKIKSITEAHTVFGHYDIIASVNQIAGNDIYHNVLTHLRLLGDYGVSTTETLHIVKFS